jgi:methylated-DNA-[protein]-cysteine S-methyltransferase
MALYKRGIKLLIGNVTLIANDDALLEIQFKKSIINDSSPVLDQAEDELLRYCSGEIEKFETPISLTGTNFQIKCWKQLLKIPFGKTISYKEEAIKVGGPNYCRAVAGANNKNKLPIIVPCHRVIGSDGRLVGYAGGLKLKERLLLIESK